MKVLVIHSTEKISGGEKVSLEIIQGLKNQYEFVLFVPQKPDKDLRNSYFKNLNVICPPDKGLFSRIRILRKILIRKNFEIIHAHGTRAAFLARLAIIGLKNRPKIVYTLHGFHLIRRPFLFRWFFLSLEKILNRWTDILVCVSEADKNLVLKYKTNTSEKIKIIKNKIDIEKFQATKELEEKTKKELGLEDNFVLCTIGRLHLQKDFSTVLRALNLIEFKMRNPKLLIVGDGPLRDSLERETKGLGIEKYVNFLGFREDIPILINLSDIIILSTKWEGLPLTPLEAGASRKPIIASNIEGVKETIIDDKTGFLFNPGSAEDLAEKILTLYNQEELRKKTGENAFRFVSENFSKERMIQEYENLYKEILNENSSG